MLRWQLYAVIKMFRVGFGPALVILVVCLGECKILARQKLRAIRSGGVVMFFYATALDVVDSLIRGTISLRHCVVPDVAHLAEPTAIGNWLDVCTGKRLGLGLRTLNLFMIVIEHLIVLFGQGGQVVRSPRTSLVVYVVAHIGDAIDALVRGKAHITELVVALGTCHNSQHSRTAKRSLLISLLTSHVVAAFIFLDVDMASGTWLSSLLDGDESALLLLHLAHRLVLSASLALVEWDLAVDAITCRAFPADEDVPVTFDEQSP